MDTPTALPAEQAMAEKASADSKVASAIESGTPFTDGPANQALSFPSQASP